MSTASSFEREMLALINQERTSRGLEPLQLETHLNASSEDHSEWMLNTDSFSHTGAGGSSATERMREAGFDFSGGWRSGENIAWQSERGAPGISDDVAQLHQNLMDSPGHRANILNPDFKYIGIGIETGTMQGYDAVVVTQNFATTDGEVALDNGDAPAAPAPTPPLVVEEPAEPEPETPVVVVEEPVEPEPETPPVVVEAPAEPEPETPVVADEPTEPEPETPETVVTDTTPPAVEEPDAGVTQPEEPEIQTPVTEVAETETPEPEMPEPTPVDTDDSWGGGFDAAALLAQLENIFNEWQTKFDNFYWKRSADTADSSNSVDFDFVSVRSNDRDTATPEPASESNSLWDFDWIDEFDFNCNVEIA
ncbi:CAP domain-containing protein [Ruegeria sp. Ofav3-42]|uniref:CAP domain-containing protein n=1 Tax=Ruegeria sp. Ofav3-42 TaxID=2917759 RepID=UPI001EF5E29C|nr:CAP domain-containing protein [Ruegeria sp. Ofav3-42]MCG7520262.1 CAP domain-containing protein [Ruegeria sp. Ofav3-42]